MEMFTKLEYNHHFFIFVAIMLLRNTTIVKGDDFQCPGVRGFYPHPVNCEKYYSCWDDAYPSLVICPTPQLFDMKYRGCNWPELTDCQDRIRPDGPQYTTKRPDTEGESSTVKPYNCPPEVSDAMFPDPEDCSSYYRCVYGNSYHYKCPTSLVFNPKIGACDFPENTSCGSRLISKH